MRFVSLGPTCETRWQLNRLLGIEPPREGFDWQITDFTALMFCLHGDFRGAFDRDFLTVAHGCVRDQRFEAVYPHSFGGENAPGDVVEIHYASERDAFERRVKRFRDSLALDENVICVRRENLTAAQVRSLHGALRRLARHNVELLVLGNYIQRERLPVGASSVAFNSRFTAYERWQGDNAGWDRALLPIIERQAASVLRRHTS